MEFIKKYWITITGILLGIAGGFLYWRFIGCESGTCAIKSNWLYMSLWGAAVGGLLGNVVKDFIKPRKKSV